MPRNVKIVTLGCPKNTVDTQQMMGYLVKEGYVLVDEADVADIIVVNTCSFIEDAQRESIETILQMAKYKERGSCQKLIVAGCLPQRHVRELAQEMPEADAFLGTGNIPAIGEVIRDACQGKRPTCVGDPNSFLYDESMPRPISDGKKYAYLKIAEGCDNRCSYCVIPQLRGSYRSRGVEEIVREAGMLAREGVKELILVAQDTTLYGYDLYGDVMLAQLLKKLVCVPGINWLRVLYSYPGHITDELLQTIREEEKICSYLDLPLQHISDHILKRMGRKQGKDETLRIIEKIRTQLPGAVLRSTFIVGFPGESEADFTELLSFLEKTRFDRAGFFMYSQENGTKAASFPGQVPQKEKLRRLVAAENLQKKILTEKQAQKIGQRMFVMADGPSLDYPGLWEGRTEGDAPEIDGVVYFQCTAGISAGDLVELKITHSQEYALIGEVLK